MGFCKSLSLKCNTDTKCNLVPMVLLEVLLYISSCSKTSSLKNKEKVIMGLLLECAEPVSSQFVVTFSLQTEILLVFPTHSQYSNFSVGLDYVFFFNNFTLSLPFEFSSGTTACISLNVVLSPSCSILSSLLSLTTGIVTALKIEGFFDP